MQVMILAAGRGKRMGYLTKTTPKPLLKLGNTTLIENNIANLKKAEITDIVVNTHYLGDKIVKYLENYNIKFSNEVVNLETAGGIINALPMLDEVFMVINADILSDYNFKNLKLPKNSLAHLVLVKNPEHNINGDFEFDNQKLTFSGIGIYHQKLFTNYQQGEPLTLGKVLKDNLANISFEYHRGLWLDVGSIERLNFAQSLYKRSKLISATNN